MPRRRTSRLRSLTVVLVGASLVLGGCARNAPNDSLKPRGYYAHQIWNLIWPVFIIAGVILVIVVGGVLYFAARYRVNNDEDWLDDTHMPPQIHGNFRMELGWTVLPAVILAVVGVFTVVTVLNLAKHPGKNALHVEVVGQQWWWEYRYDLNHDGKYDDIVTSTELVIPAGQKVALRMTSRDVLHGWWVPRLNGKRDVVPNHPTDFAVEADNPGEYTGECTVFCGLSHANMRFKVVALSNGDFQDWLRNQQQPAATPTSPKAVAGQEVFNNFCTGCHVLESKGVKQPTSADVKKALLSGEAPNLTHLMSRTTFASGEFDLRKPTAKCKAQGILYDIPSCVNEADLRAWIHDAPGQLPMDPANRQGMPAFTNITPGDLDNLVAYLETLK
ncbi:MAG TPA: cytochrome c oxidase subunit II [Acidimicrobiales bacterium]|jgi:cytochrome c oxidase subunit 2|nr:cytochrome c oxidase subunit II [Acidimicrobiales bacterium]